MDLLDCWTGRNLAAGKRGGIPDHLEPILQRLGIVSSGWCDLIQQFGRLVKRAVGSPQALANEAKARGQSICTVPKRPPSQLADRTLVSLLCSSRLLLLSTILNQLSG